MDPFVERECRAARRVDIGSLVGRERARAAIKNSGLVYPLRRITANLAPAELPKHGPSYDLPLALAILVASGQVEQPAPGAMFLGEPESALEAAATLAEESSAEVGLVHRGAQFARAQPGSWTVSGSRS